MNEILHRRNVDVPAPVKPRQNNDIVIHSTPVAVRPRNASSVQVRPKAVVIAGRQVDIDPHELIRLIKRVTQNIGEYKDLDDVYSTIICGSLRKARGDLVNLLESKFHIHWEIDRESGQSVFYM